MNANASRPVVRKARPSRMSSPSSSASCAAVRTCAVGGSSEATLALQLGLRDAVAPGDEREVDLALLVEQLLGRREVEDDEGGPAEPGRLADGGEADELEGALRRARGDRDLVAELEVLLVGGGGVERDLALALGRAALGEADRGERRRHVGRGDRRRPAGRDDLAVLADHRGDVVDLPRHLLHVGQALDVLAAASRRAAAASRTPSRPGSRPETTTSAPLVWALKMSSNAFWIVSVRTNVPAIIVTPSRTAMIVSEVRSLRAASPRSARRVTPGPSSGRGSGRRRGRSRRRRSGRRRGRSRGRRSPRRRPRA